MWLIPPFGGFGRDAFCSESRGNGVIKWIKGDQLAAALLGVNCREASSRRGKLRCEWNPSGCCTTVRLYRVKSRHNEREL
jgi:hypothetical protein